MSCENTCTKPEENKGLGEAIKRANYALEEATKLGHDLLALPNDWTTHDLEKFAPSRRRARGEMSTTHTASFAAYVRQAEEVGTTVFVNPRSMTAVAVINMGTPDMPNHCDNKATLEAQKTAAYVELMDFCTSNRSQASVAEWLEDHAHHIVGVEASEGARIDLKPAIQAIRKITVEAMRKLETDVQTLSTSRSAFESAQIKSKDSLPVPEGILYSCAPYHGLSERTFRLRLTISTAQDKPQIRASIVGLEAIREEIAVEFADNVSEAFNPNLPVIDAPEDGAIEGVLVGSSHIPVLIGSYVAK